MNESWYAFLVVLGGKRYLRTGGFSSACRQWAKMATAKKHALAEFEREPNCVAAGVERDDGVTWLVAPQERLLNSYHRVMWGRSLGLASAPTELSELKEHAGDVLCLVSVTPIRID